MSFPSIYFDGYYRILSHTPSPENDTPKFGDSFRSFDAAALKEIDMSWQGHRILNQKSTNSCVGHASTAGMEILQKQRQIVQKNFNPFFHYALINGGQDGGAYISDSLNMLRKYGICETSAFPYDRVYYKSSLTKAAYDNAARFKLGYAYQCNTFEEVCQAISLGFVVNIGILVGSNFTKVDSEGIAPLPNGGGGGHSMLACGIKQHSKYGWLVKLQNSWGSSFGLGGYCYVRKEHFTSRSKLDCFAFQGVIEDHLDQDKTDDVPVVKV